MSTRHIAAESARLHDLTPEGASGRASKRFRQRLASDGFTVDEGFRLKPGYLYTVVRAISARVNQNYDGWPSDELKRSYKTFIGKPVFVNHENHDPTKARGVVVAARYVENGMDKFIEVVQEIDAGRFPKLAHEIKTGGLDSVSMGAEAGFTICSYCHNKATDVPDMCDHVLNHKGKTLTRFDKRTGKKEDVLVFESCHKISFFELSYVFEPADETAVASKVVVAGKSDDSLGRYVRENHPNLDPVPKGSIGWVQRHGPDGKPFGPKGRASGGSLDKIRVRWPDDTESWEPWDGVRQVDPDEWNPDDKQDPFDPRIIGASKTAAWSHTDHGDLHTAPSPGHELHVFSPHVAPAVTDHSGEELLPQGGNTKHEWVHTHWGEPVNGGMADSREDAVQAAEQSHHELADGFDPDKDQDPFDPRLIGAGRRTAEDLAVPAPPGTPTIDQGVIDATPVIELQPATELTGHEAPGLGKQSAFDEDLAEIMRLAGQCPPGQDCNNMLQGEQITKDSPNNPVNQVSSDPNGTGGLGQTPGTSAVSGGGGDDTGGTLKPQTQKLQDSLKKMFPGVDIGGYRPPDGYNEHSSGSALDFMTTDHGQAKSVMDHAFSNGANYVIWDQKQWNPDGTSSAMPDRGDPTQNHKDHVHINVGKLAGKYTKDDFAVADGKKPWERDTDSDVEDAAAIEIEAMLLRTAADEDLPPLPDDFHVPDSPEGQPDRSPGWLHRQFVGPHKSVWSIPEHELDDRWNKVYDTLGFDDKTREQWEAGRQTGKPSDKWDAGLDGPLGGGVKDYLTRAPMSKEEYARHREHSQNRAKEMADGLWGAMFPPEEEEGRKAIQNMDTVGNLMSNGWQPEHIKYDEDGDPYALYQHPSGWNIKDSGYNYKDIGHAATPGETHDVINVSRHDRDSGESYNEPFGPADAHSFIEEQLNGDPEETGGTLQHLTQNHPRIRRYRPGKIEGMAFNPNTQHTQLGKSTLRTYFKAHDYLDDNKAPRGRTLDFGAGRGYSGLPVKDGGLGYHTFEPNQAKFVGKKGPTYTDCCDIPDAAYKRVVSLNVLNVLDPHDEPGGRVHAVQEIGRILSPGGHAILTTRPDVTRGVPPEKFIGDEPGAVWMGPKGKERRQKGFTRGELHEYVSGVLGDGYTVSPIPNNIGGAGVMVVRNHDNITASLERSSAVKKLARQRALRLAYGETEAPMAVDTLREEGSAPEDDDDDFEQYVKSPADLKTPDLSQAQQIDREQEIAGAPTDQTGGVPGAAEGGPVPGQAPQQQMMTLQIPMPSEAPQVPQQAAPPVMPPQDPSQQPPMQMSASTLDYFDRYYGRRVANWLDAIEARRAFTPAEAADYRRQAVRLSTLENGREHSTTIRNPRKEPADMARNNIASRSKVARAGRRQHLAEGPYTDGSPYGRNDEGEQEEAFISQTPPPVAGDFVTDEGSVSNTEHNLVARVQQGRDQLLRDARQLASLRQRRAFDEAGGPTAEVVDPKVHTGPEGEALTGTDFISADPNDGVVPTNPKDASLRAFQAFDGWLAQKTGKSSRRHTEANIKKAAAAFSREAGISPQALFPALGIVLREARKNNKKANTKGAAMRKRADEKLEVAAPDGRIDVEAPVENVTSAEAQASQFDLHDFGNNAGDNVAKPDLSTDQNWAPGEASGKKASIKTAGGLLAMRCAEAMIEAGLEPNERERKYQLAAQFENMNRGLIQDRVALLERFAAVRQADLRRVASGSSRGAARSPIPAGLGGGTRTASTGMRTAAHDPSNDSTLFI